MKCNHEDAMLKIARLEEKLYASEKSLGLAREAIEKRLEGVFVTFKDLDSKIQVSEKNRKDNLALIVSGLSILIALFSFLIRAKVS